jgi:nucleotide-binding universal stress UspA family protein
MTLFQRIVCPTDFSPTAARALDLATRIAAASNAQLVLLHVVPAVNYPSRGIAIAGAFPQLEHELQVKAKERLDQQPVAAPSVTVRREVRNGDPYEQILACARDTKADLIVLGTHGHTGLVHALLGSTAERIVRLAECPVLTVRAKA